jgi:glycosyltransferase involved in cell wall biosynthesis
MLSVTYYYREPRRTGVSIEGIFRQVKADLINEVTIKEFYCDAHASRLQNTRNAGGYSGEVNHITGDVNFLALGLKGKKNILTIHDMGHYETLRKRSLLQFLVYKTFWFSLPLKHIHTVTVVSRFTKEKLMTLTGYPENRIRIIADPVKPIFQFSPERKPNTKPVILMMGTGKHKNLDNLINAAKGSGYHLDIIGWPSDEQQSRLREYNISHSIHNGLTDEEVYDHYLNCDILFNASHYEGFGMPVIEAQATGRAVITSNTGAMKEVGGDTAVSVDPNDPKAIREALDKLTSDSTFYNEMIAKGKRNAARFDHQQISNQYLKLYREVANI